ncbi:hypothetical protein STEG23_036280 [Scotinomys teguina]
MSEQSSLADTHNIKTRKQTLMLHPKFILVAAKTHNADTVDGQLNMNKSVASEFYLDEAQVPTPNTANRS